MAPSSAGPGKRLQRHDTATPNPIGGNASSTVRWHDVPRGTTNEVRSYVCLDLPLIAARPTQRLFHPVLEPHAGRALVPIPQRSASPWATSTLYWWTA